MNSGSEQLVSALRVTDRSVTTLTDREVVDNILNGDKHLFELLMRRHNRRMFRLARSILKDSMEAEDVLQEGYMLAYTKLQTFKGAASAGGWLARIIVNEALGRLRRRHIHTLDSLDNGIDLENMNVTLENPEQLVNGHETLWMIESAIDRLPKCYRMVFVLRAVEQLSVNETAEYLDIPPATVKSRFHRARSILQNRLLKQVDELTQDVFTFGGSRCDRIVVAVYRRLAGTAGQNHQV
ncbi:MAG TPA: RNA polymerase sigma factor [Gammaproteobacteria bacterium]